MKAKFAFFLLALLLLVAGTTVMADVPTDPPTEVCVTDADSVIVAGQATTEVFAVDLPAVDYLHYASLDHAADLPAEIRIVTADHGWCRCLYFGSLHSLSANTGFSSLPYNLGLLAPPDLLQRT